VAPVVVNARHKVKDSAVRAMVNATTVHTLLNNVVKVVPVVMIAVRKPHVKPARKATASPAAVAVPISVAHAPSRNSSNVRAPSAVIVRSSKANASIPRPSLTMLR
jgi:hypothetical protein